jgi:hypothetical protein
MGGLTADEEKEFRDLKRYLLSYHELGLKGYNPPIRNDIMSCGINWLNIQPHYLKDSMMSSGQWMRINVVFMLH